MDALKVNGEMTMDEMIDSQYGDDPDGGPLYARECIWQVLYRLRRKTGRSIKSRTVYRLE